MATLTQSPTPNFETLTGQNVATGLYPSMGVQAKSPNTGLKPSTNTISKAQTAPVTPPTSTPNTTGNTGATLNGQPVSGAPGGPINGGNITQNNATPDSQNGIQVGGPGYVAPTIPTSNFTTPSGATVDSNGNLVSSSSNSGGLYGSLINNLTTTAGGNAALGQQAANIGNDYSSQIKALQTQMVSNEGTVGGQGLQPIALGRAGLIANNMGSEIQGLTQAENAALAGNAQQLTAQNQQQTGVASAAGLAAPANTNVQLPYNMQYLNASTGAPIGTAGSANGSLSDAVNNAVQLIKNGSGYNNAAGTLSAYGQAGTNALVQALGPSFNINASNADAAAQAQNINTSATTVNSTAAQGYSTSFQAYQNLNQTYQGAQNLGQLLASTMEKGGINSNGSIDLNQAANTLAAHVSSEDYSNFVSTLNSTRTAYQNILTASGATPTGAEASLLASLNPNSSMNAIISNINQLNNEVYSGKIVPAASTANYYHSLLTGQ